MRAPADPVVPGLVQGAFYLASGLWPLVHLRSFEAVTGPKVDRWLVRTVGGLVAAVGAALVVGSLERGGRRSRALPVLGIGSALVLAAVDVSYSLRGRISTVYLADAAAEVGLVGLWAAARAR